MTLQLLKHTLLRLPGVQALRLHRQLQRYLHGHEGHPHWGHFQSFDQARQWLPPSTEFDTVSLREQYEGVRTHRIFAYDYPVLYWLRLAFDEGAREVLDIGGSVGVHCLAYRRYLDYPPAWRWTVVEVPAMVQVGREIAQREGLSALHFTGDIEPAAAAAQVWLSAGAIHYLEHGRPSDLLARLGARPRYLILNKLPLYSGPDFVSTQRLAPGVFAPHHVYQRSRWIADIVRQGYELLDSWEVHERSFALPGHPACDFPTYSGLCLRRREG